MLSLLGVFGGGVVLRWFPLFLSFLYFIRGNAANRLATHHPLEQQKKKRRHDWRVSWLFGTTFVLQKGSSLWSWTEIASGRQWCHLALVHLMLPNLNTEREISSHL